MTYRNANKNLRNKVVAGFLVAVFTVTLLVMYVTGAF